MEIVGGGCGVEFFFFVKNGDIFVYLCVSRNIVVEKEKNNDVEVGGVFFREKFLRRWNLLYNGEIVFKVLIRIINILFVGM